MDKGGLIIIAAVAAATVVGLVAWLFFRPKGKQPAKTPERVLEQAAKDDVESIFNEEFREELRNRGRLHFEKIIGENAMFLQQDLRQTTAQINDFMRSEITSTLQEEFKKYEQSISDAKQLALDSIDKTIATIEQQRAYLQQQLQTQSEAQKAEVLSRFEAEMARIINHYVLRAIGNQIDLTDQLEYILSELEANKKAIIEDVKGSL